MVSEAAFFGPSYTEVCEGPKTSAGLRRTKKKKGRKALSSYKDFFFFYCRKRSGAVIDSQSA